MASTEIPFHTLEWNGISDVVVGINVQQMMD